MTWPAWCFFAIAFSVLYGLDSLLGRFAPLARPALAAGIVSHRHEDSVSGSRGRIVTLVLALSVIAATFLAPQHYRADQIDDLRLETLVPERFSGWVHDQRAEIAVVSPEIKADLQRLYSQSLARTYVNAQGERVMLSIAYGGHQLGNALQAHRPEYCYRAQGFTLLGMEETTLSLVGQSLPVRRLLTRLDDRMEPVTYWMTVGEQLALPGLSRKLAQIRYGLQGEIPDGMLVRVSSLDRDSGRAFALQARFIADLQGALPGRLGFIRTGEGAGT
jgi:EpsI family protein